MPNHDPSDLTHLLGDDDIVAIVASQRLRPAEGDGMPFFPPTYLGSDDKPTYCISTLPNGGNLCTVDSVQSQANRIEEAFLHPPYRELVRKIEVTALLANGQHKTLDMLELGHRLADAAVTFSSLKDTAQQALRAFAQGPEEIARLSPMSLVCGLWESRGETAQLKIPRAFSATITARNVSPLRRMATFTGSFWSKELGFADKHAEAGIDPVPAGEALGGVIAQGSIERTATLNLIALRQNCHIAPAQPTTDCARYLYGLGLVALTMQPEAFLRQGCLLVAAEEVRARVVTRRGLEHPLALNHGQALAFAQAGALAFGIADLPPLQAQFDPDAVQKSKAAKTPKAKPQKGA